MKNEFNIGDLVRHLINNHTGVVLQIVKYDHLSYNRAPIYKVAWSHGEWMFEVEEHLKIEAKARSA